MSVGCDFHILSLPLLPAYFPPIPTCHHSNFTEPGSIAESGRTTVFSASPPPFNESYFLSTIFQVLCLPLGMKWWMRQRLSQPRASTWAENLSFKRIRQCWMEEKVKGKFICYKQHQLSLWTQPKGDIGKRFLPFLGDITEFQQWKNSVLWKISG